MKKIFSKMWAAPAALMLGFVAVPASADGACGAIPCPPGISGSVSALFGGEGVGGFVSPDDIGGVNFIKGGGSDSSFTLFDSSRCQEAECPGGATFTLDQEAWETLNGSANAEGTTADAETGSGLSGIVQAGTLFQLDAGGNRTSVMGIGTALGTAEGGGMFSGGNGEVVTNSTMDLYVSNNMTTGEDPVCVYDPTCATFQGVTEAGGSASQSVMTTVTGGTSGDTVGVANSGVTGLTLGISDSYNFGPIPSP